MQATANVEQREQDTIVDSERLQDSQAIFLIEVMSQFRGRRSAKSLSSRFVKTYQNSFWNYKNTASSMAALLSPLNHGDDDTTADQWSTWVERTSWQRLLQACYILASHQALLLAREPTPSLIQDTGYELPFPAPLALWDAETNSEWCCAIQQSPHWFQHVYEVIPALLTRPLDTFQSSMVLAAHYNRFDAYTPYGAMPPAFDLSEHLDPSPAVSRLHLTAKLAHVTPLRALLAVAGESWVFSDKVSVDAYAEFKTTLRTWMAQLWGSDEQTHGRFSPVGQALTISVEMLTAAMEAQDGEAPELGTDVGVYFAALVVWAVGVAVTGSCAEDPDTAQPCYSSPCPYLSQPEHTAVALSFLSTVVHDYTDTTAVDGSTTGMARCQTGCTALLLWAKSRLCGRGSGGEESLGELLDSVGTTIGGIVDRGWRSWRGDWT